MYTARLIAALAALTAAPAFAQLASLPPPSSTEGVPVSSIGPNAGISHWENPTTLGGFRLASETTVPLQSLPGSTQVTWASTAPAALLENRASIVHTGGAVRAIFVGESAGWINDFGYTYSGHPAGPESFTVFKAIQAQAPATIAFGDHADLLFSPDDPFGTNFDFWFNGSGSFTSAKTSPPTDGGVYTVFAPAKSEPFVASGNIKFAQSPLLVSTYAWGDYRDIPTYLVAIEDWRLDREADADYTDFIFALQFFQAVGTPGADIPVPEPSTYSLAAATFISGLAFWRRSRSRTRG